MARRLENAGLVLTRPASPDEELAERLRGEGARVLPFPAQQVEPVPTVPPAGDFDVALFTSPAAVRFGLARIAQALPPLLAATGMGTARRLAAAGVREVLAPVAGAGIHALLADPRAEVFSGKRLLVICGRPVNGRSLQAVARRCAKSEIYVVYRRRPVTDPEPLAGWLRSGEANAIMASSVAAVDALFALPGMAWGDIAWIASSKRVAHAVARAGSKQVFVSASAKDTDLLAAAVTWWRSLRGNLAEHV